VVCRSRQALYDTVAEITPDDRARVDRALELACGTGIWTGELVKLADHVTALDASPEVIAINRAKLREGDDPDDAADRVTFVERDIFAWKPDQQYDLVFFGFWLSHVPPERLDAFLATVACALKPGGRVFMVDSRRTSSAGAQGQQVQPPEVIRQQRQLKDGRTFQVVKIYYVPDALAAHFARARIAAAVQTTANFFIYAAGRCASP
jgi:ubiquinone/menaquinone biosynthesis C-methylase UbiE